MPFCFPAGGAAAMAAAVVLAAGCSSAAPPAHRAAPSTHSAPSSAAAQPPSGPFQIKALYCGKFSKAQQAQYADFSGLIFRYTNVSNSVIGAPNLTVNFTRGSTVAGSNVNGASTLISPGQSATADVGAVGGLGQVLKFTGCQMMTYGVVTASGGQPGNFTP